MKRSVCVMDFMLKKLYNLIKLDDEVTRGISEM